MATPVALVGRGRELSRLMESALESALAPDTAPPANAPPAVLPAATPAQPVTDAGIPPRLKALP